MKGRFRLNLRLGPLQYLQNVPSVVVLIVLTLFLCGCCCCPWAIGAGHR